MMSPSCMSRGMGGHLVGGDEGVWEGEMESSGTKDLGVALSADVPLWIFAFVLLPLRIISVGDGMQVFSRQTAGSGFEGKSELAARPQDFYCIITYGVIP